MLLHSACSAHVHPAAPSGLNVGSVRINNANAFLRRSSVSGIDEADSTMCGWFKMKTDRNNYSGLMYMDRPGSFQYQQVVTESNGTSLRIYNTSFSPQIVNMSVNTWYFCSIVWGSGTCTARVSNEFGAWSTRVRSITNVSNLTELGFGATSNYFSEWFNGEVALLRAWSDQLSEAELEAERASEAPVKTSDLWGDWRCASQATVLTDSSGNGRDFDTIGGANHSDGDGLVVSF